MHDDDGCAVGFETFDVGAERARVSKVRFAYLDFRAAHDTGDAVTGHGLHIGCFDDRGRCGCNDRCGKRMIAVRLQRRSPPQHAVTAVAVSCDHVDDDWFVRCQRPGLVERHDTDRCQRF